MAHVALMKTAANESYCSTPSNNWLDLTGPAAIVLHEATLGATIVLGACGRRGPQAEVALRAPQLNQKAVGRTGRRDEDDAERAVPNLLQCPGGPGGRAL